MLSRALPAPFCERSHAAMRHRYFCETDWTGGSRGGIMAVYRMDKGSVRDRAAEQGI